MPKYVLNANRAASDLIEELLDSKRYNSRARPQADSSMISVHCFNKFTVPVSYTHLTLPTKRIV